MHAEEPEPFHISIGDDSDDDDTDRRDPGAGKQRSAPVVKQSNVISDLAALWGEQPSEDTGEGDTGQATVGGHVTSPDEGSDAPRRTGARDAEDGLPDDHSVWNQADEPQSWSRAEQPSPWSDAPPAAAAGMHSNEPDEEPDTFSFVLDQGVTGDPWEQYASKADREPVSWDSPRSEPATVWSTPTVEPDADEPRATTARPREDAGWHDLEAVPGPTAWASPPTVGSDDFDPGASDAEEPEHYTVNIDEEPQGPTAAMRIDAPDDERPGDRKPAPDPDASDEQDDEPVPFVAWIGPATDDETDEAGADAGLDEEDLAHLDAFDDLFGSLPSPGTTQESDGLEP